MRITLAVLLLVMLKHVDATHGNSIQKSPFFFSNLIFIVFLESYSVFWFFDTIMKQPLFVCIYSCEKMLVGALGE